MAGDFRGTDRAAGHDSAGSGDERHSACGASAFVLAVWTFGFEADLRRRVGQRLEPRAGAGAVKRGHAAAECRAANGYGLESGWADLFLHAAEYQSRL